MEAGSHGSRRVLNFRNGGFKSGQCGGLGLREARTVAGFADFGGANHRPVHLSYAMASAHSMLRCKCLINSAFARLNASGLFSPGLGKKYPSMRSSVCSSSICVNSALMMISF